MQATTPAISGDAQLLWQLRTGRFTATVHSVFDSVVNLQDRTGRLVTLAARHLDNAPNTLVLDLPSVRPLDAQVGARVATSGTHLVSLRPLRIDLAPAREWTPVLPDLSAALDADPQVLDRAATELERLVDREGQRGGIRPRPGAGTIETEVSRELETTSRLLVQALAVADLDAATHWAGRLIGLGPGLTPSGDDFITGMAATFAARGTRIHRLLPWVTLLVRDGEARTNSISWTAMDEATRGRVRESIVTLLLAIATGEPHAVCVAARKVMDIGKTSGTDIVTGMQAALHLEKELRGVA